MENALNINFEGSGESRDLFSEAGVSAPGRARVTVEADLIEMTDEGAMLIPDKILSVESMDAAEDAGGEDDTPSESGSDENDEDTPGMVLVMKGKDKGGS